MNNESLPPPNAETRQERREKRLRKQRERMQQHGKTLGKIYTEVVRKRGKGKK